MLSFSSGGLARYRLGSICIGKTRENQGDSFEVAVHDDSAWLWEAAHNMPVCACVPVLCHSESYFLVCDSCAVSAV